MAITLSDTPTPGLSTAVRYVRDATDRIVSRSEGTLLPLPVGTRSGYSGPGDTPDYTVTAEALITERHIGLIGGASITKRPLGADVWSYPNIHGDVVATANPAGAKQGPTLTYDPYGQALGGIPDNADGNFDYGWLGRQQRGLEHAGGAATVEMGARQYVPGLGRFLEVDPVEGGCANDYVYVGGDPINELDVDGMRTRSTAESAACAMSGSLACWRVGRTEKWSVSATAASGERGGYRNAFRHCVLAAALTWDLGSSAAHLALKSHEFGRSASRARDSQADDDNSAVGMKIGKSETWFQREGSARKAFVNKCTQALRANSRWGWGRLNTTSGEG
jgi:RHS repeat-associated protein